MTKPILLLPMLASVALLAACSSTTPAAPVSSPAAQGVSCVYQATGDAAKQVELPPTSGVPNTGTVDYVLKLNGSAVPLTLDRERTPCTVNSLTSLAAQGFFDDTACHRLVDSGIYVLQCGDPSGTGAGGPGYQFADELTGTETYPAGTLAMANAGPGTNGSQFFIVYGDSPLGPNYTVFGTVSAEGLAVVEKIAAGGQDNSFGASGGGVPNLPATITAVVPA